MLSLMHSEFSRVHPFMKILGHVILRVSTNLHSVTLWLFASTQAEVRLRLFWFQLRVNAWWRLLTGYHLLRRPKPYQTLCNSCVQHSRERASRLGSQLM